MAERFLTPHASAAMTDANGKPRPDWMKYLGGIETISKRLDGVEDLAGAALLADVIDKINEILAAYRTTE